MFIENSIKNFDNHLKPQKRINKSRFYYESGWVQSSSVTITELIVRIAYGDTAAATSCVPF